VGSCKLHRNTGHISGRISTESLGAYADMVTHIGGSRAGELPDPEAAVGGLCGLRVSPPFADPPLTTQTMSRLNAILASCLTDPHPCVRAAELASFAVFSRPNTPHLGRFIPAMFMTRLLRVRPCSSIG
jgi:hypothetical protein